MSGMLKEHIIRHGLVEIVEGWAFSDDCADLSRRIERACQWAKRNVPLRRGEKLLLRILIRAQVARREAKERKEAQCATNSTTSSAAGC